MLPLSYDIRNLQVRRIRTLTTAAGVALVVGVFCYLLSLADGLRRTLRLTGDPHNVTIIADGATSESNSAITHAESRRLVGIPGVAIGNRGRPLVSERQRAELLAGLECVDHVVLFGEDTAGPLIRALQPQIVCKGGEYRGQPVPERAVIESIGGRFVLLRQVPGSRSSLLVRRLSS